MAKKTFSVAEFAVSINEILRKTAPARVVERAQSMVILENMLHQTGNYKGFRYLTESEVEGNPGIRMGKTGMLSPEKRFVNTDRTRVEYFI